MKRGIAELLVEIRAAAAELRRTGGIVSGEAAAHVHVAAATGTAPGGLPRYAALVPRRIEAVFADDDVGGHLVQHDESAVALVLRSRLDLFATNVTLADGTVVPTLTREAVLALLLAEGGLAIALAGSIVALANRPAIDVDEVREILKSAGRGECFQPLLELLDVA